VPGGREKGGKGAFKGKRELWHTRGAKAEGGENM